ncbi:MAG TPA: type II toxin-antitoxin system VapC family toxin [Candidatus Limnocylindria bacterium]|nr:type II toxin-antitoxin system VapC family toxin [Candidatus Limnocylindria bacterium]
MLGWLLGEPRADLVRHALSRAELVLASDLTLIECDRILIRRQAAGGLSGADAMGRHGALVAAARRWSLMRIEGDVIERARRPFPVEPVRTLDALHLSSALVASAWVADLALLSLDERVRTAARALGLPIVPA